jgi:hypothetical protein
LYPAAVDPDDTDSGAAPYRRIAHLLRAEIVRGDLPAGAQLPTQEALARRFEVSRATIQRALDELRQDGYIDSQQGRGSFVLQRARHESTFGPAGVRLAPSLNAAFQAPHVTLDVFSLTAETLYAALQQPLQRVRTGELRPESVALRLLLPAPDARLAVPQSVADAEDERPLRRLRRLLESQSVGVQSALYGLRDLGHVSDVTVEIRSVAITPVHKLYLLNGEDALFGYYEIIERPVRIAGGDVDIFDVLGLGATLFHFSAGPDTDEQGKEFVARSQRWFDSLWSTIAEPWET